jgi:hypothetical protein
MALQIGEKKRIQSGVVRRVYELTSNKQEAIELFRQLYRDLKSWFRVEKYTEIKREDLQAAISFIEMWRPRKKSP